MDDQRPPLPPHSLDAEESTLGSMLIDSECVPEVMSVVKPKDFFRDKNMWVMMACLRLWKKREAINQITVGHELQKSGHLEPCGGSEYLSNLIYNVPTSVHAKHYAGIVKRLSTMRDLIEAGDKISKMGYNGDSDNPGEQISEAVSILLKISSTSDATKGYTSMAQIASDLFDDADSLFSREFSRGMSTGFKKLDRSFGGFLAGRQYIIASRPGIGKTSLMCEMARRIGEAGTKVGIVSLEMTKDELGQKMACAIARLNEQSLRCGLMDNSITMEQESEYRDSYQFGLDRVNELPIFIDDDPRQTSLEIEARAMALKQRHGVDVIFIDHLSLTADKVGKGESDVKRLDQITQNFKIMAKTMQVPVIALCQLNRNLEYREDKMPRMSDLRASGGIEQNADVVLGLYRPSYYYEDCDDPNMLKVLHLKNRKGLAGGGFGVSLDFDMATGRITEME